MNRKYRVLYICIDPALGGSTSSLYNLIDSLRDVVEPIVLFPELGVGYQYFINHGIESYVYPFYQFNGYTGNDFRSVWKHPWRWHYIDKILSDIGCCYFLKKMLTDRGIHIVHSNTSPNDVGVAISRFFHAKHVWHVREFLDLDFHVDVYRGIPRLRKLINQADARIAISSAIKEHWQMPENMTWIIHNAVRKKEEKCLIEKKEKYLLVCAYNLTESKGARFAIQAFAKSEVKNEGYSLKLVGNCSVEYYESLCDTAKELGVLNSVDFIPCQSEVKDYFAYATAFIMASEFEAFGRVSAEAMFFGCPVIARATGGSLDIIKNGETGYLFSTMDECTALIKKVCSEDQTQIIRRAQDYAVSNFSQEVYSLKVLNVYKCVRQ